MHEHGPEVWEVMLSSFSLALLFARLTQDYPAIFVLQDKLQNYDLFVDATSEVS